MNIYYAYIPNIYEHNIGGYYDFKIALSEFKFFRFKYLYAVYINKKVKYFFLYHPEIIIFDEKGIAENYAENNPRGKIYKIAIAAEDQTKPINNIRLYLE